MRFKINGKQCLLDGRFAETRGGALSFQVTGSHFPYSNFEPPDPNTAAFNGTAFLFVSKEPNAATINFGDGSIMTYQFVPSGGTYLLQFKPSVPAGGSTSQPVHNYTDSNTGKRIVQITFSQPDLITDFSSVYVNMYSVFPSGIVYLSAMASMTITSSKIDQFPVALSSLTSLRLLNLSQIGNAILLRIPNEFLSLKLSSLLINGSTDLSNLETSNFIALCNSTLKNTLTSLSIGTCKLSALPPELSNLVNLQYLDISNSLFDTIPTLHLQSLQTLRCGAGSTTNTTLKSWGDFQYLVNLSKIDCVLTPFIESNLPGSLQNCTLLKTLSFQGTYNTTNRIDTFINNLYTFIVANAAITGASTLKFRGMSVLNYHSSESGGIPTGVYQQPAGFVLGSSNGTPASPREKIWVMVNQYGHTWTYATS